MLALALLAILAAAAPARAALPPVGHVFVIVLENKDYDTSWGPQGKSPYLRSLPERGVLLTQYFGIGHNSLTDYVAMVSGQAPNPITQADAQFFQEVVPGTIGPDGQAMGTGAVYPATVKTVADQLEEKGLTWGGYMEDMGNTPGEPATCRHPAINARDTTQSARKDDQYATRHNPFVYFHSIIDRSSCDRNDVPLDRLPAALDSGPPNFSFITPDLCSDGHDEPCIDGRPGGYASIDAFLREWVPRIEASRAFRDGGALVVTFDESEDGAEACCVQDTPNTPNGGGETPGPGGGRVGAVVLSPYVKPGTVTDKPYNHYSFLRTVEDLFGLAPLGYAARSTAFGDDVFNGPRCFDHPLANGPNLPPGAMIASLRRSGRLLTMTMAHGAQLTVRAHLRRGSRRAARRHVNACATVRVRLPAAPARPSSRHRCAASASGAS